MCAYSMVADHYRQRTVDEWDFTKWQDYQELVRKAKKYDEMTGQKECQLDEKIEWERTIEKVLREKGLIV